MNSIAEVNIGIICGCLPILPSFTNKLVSKAATSNNSIGNSNHYQLEQIWKPKRNIEDSMMRTQTRPDESNERLTVVQSTTVEVDRGNNTWQDDGITKTVEINQRI